MRMVHSLRALFVSLVCYACFFPSRIPSENPEEGASVPAQEPATTQLEIVRLLNPQAQMETGTSRKCNEIYVKRNAQPSYAELSAAIVGPNEVVLGDDIVERARPLASTPGIDAYEFLLDADNAVALSSINYRVRGDSNEPWAALLSGEIRVIESDTSSSDFGFILDREGQPGETPWERMSNLSAAPGASFTVTAHFRCLEPETLYRLVPRLDDFPSANVSAYARISSDEPFGIATNGVDKRDLQVTIDASAPVGSYVFELVMMGGSDGYDLPLLRTQRFSVQVLAPERAQDPSSTWDLPRKQPTTVALAKVAGGLLSSIEQRVQPTGEASSAWRRSPLELLNPGIRAVSEDAPLVTTTFAVEPEIVSTRDGAGAYVLRRVGQLDHRLRLDFVSAAGTATTLSEDAIQTADFFRDTALAVADDGTVWVGAVRSSGQAFVRSYDPINQTWALLMPIGNSAREIEIAASSRVVVGIVDSSTIRLHEQGVGGGFQLSQTISEASRGLAMASQGADVILASIRSGMNTLAVRRFSAIVEAIDFPVPESAQLGFSNVSVATSTTQISVGFRDANDRLRVLTHDTNSWRARACDRTLPSMNDQAIVIDGDGVTVLSSHDDMATMSYCD
jgi:hypothetical protein